MAHLGDCGGERVKPTSLKSTMSDRKESQFNTACSDDGAATERCTVSEERMSSAFGRKQHAENVRRRCFMERIIPGCRSSDRRVIEYLQNKRIRRLQQSSASPHQGQELFQQQVVTCSLNTNGFRPFQLQDTESIPDNDGFRPPKVTQNADIDGLRPSQLKAIQSVPTSNRLKALHLKIEQNSTYNDGPKPFQMQIAQNSAQSDTFRPSQQQLALNAARNDGFRLSQHQIAHNATHNDGFRPPNRQMVQGRYTANNDGLRPQQQQVSQHTTYHGGLRPFQLPNTQCTPNTHELSINRCKPSYFHKCVDADFCGFDETLRPGIWDVDTNQFGFADKTAAPDICEQIRLKARLEIESNDSYQSSECDSFRSTDIESKIDLDERIDDDDVSSVDLNVECQKKKAGNVFVRFFRRIKKAFLK